MPDYIYKTQPKRRNFVETLSSEESTVMSAHFDYLKVATETGKVLLAGPCLDEAFGIVVFKEENREKAEEFMQGDPAVSAGLFIADLHEFKVSLLNTKRS